MNITIRFALASILIATACGDLSAQKKKFFDFNGNKCKEKAAYYYRIIVPQGSRYKVTEYFKDNDQVKMEGQYSSKKIENNYREGDFTFYYPNGQKHIDAHFKGGKGIERWTYYYKDGQVQAEGELEKGERTGEWVMYHRNGAIKSKPVYVEGGKDGNVITYKDNGEKKEEYNYLKGKKNGEYIIYHPENKIKTKGGYVKDSLDGEWTQYWKNGNLSIKGEYSDNKKNGTWEYYHSNGNKSADVDYSKKGVFTKASYYDEDGKKLSKKVTKDDLEKSAEHKEGRDGMYKEINTKLNEKLDFPGMKRERYKVVALCVLTIDEEGNITERNWIVPDGDEDDYDDRWDFIKYINSAIDDFPKFKPAKKYNRAYEDTVVIFYNQDFSKL